MTDKSLLSNSKRAFNYLKNFRDKGVHNLIAISPLTERVTGLTRPTSHDDIEAFINKHNGKSNLYFSVNEPKENAPDYKLKKEHINTLHAVWLDADPRKDKPFIEERARLLDLTNQLKNDKNPPTYIVDSGNGIQAFWLLNTPLPATSENIAHLESLSRGLAEKHGTDYVQNIDRIMRIPFTENVPTKRKKDRPQTTAKVLHATSRRGQRYDQLDFIIPSVKKADNDTFTDTELDMEAIKKDIPDELLSRLQATLRDDGKAHDLYFGIIEKPSRSEYDFTLTQQLVWSGYSLQEVAHILYHYPHGKGSGLTKREIIRCYNRIDNPFKGLDPDYIKQIEEQSKLRASKLQPKSTDWKIIPLKDMDWRYSGSPIYKNILYNNAITVVYGQSNVGKSFVASDLAGHIALARDWAGNRYKAKAPIGVLYICAEAGKSFGKRGKALMKRLNVDDIPFYVLDAAPNFAKAKDDAVKLVKAINELEQSQNVSIGLVVVDTLATTFEGGNENSSEDMGLYISNMKYIQRYADTGVLIVHHSGKDQAAGARGHSSLRAATDTEMEVTAEKKGTSYHRCIKIRKQREGECDIKIRFGLSVVELGTDSDGDTIDSCHVVLEDDLEFDSIVPSPIDELEDGERAVVIAHAIYDSVPLVGAVLDEYDLTEPQLKAMLHRDIKTRAGVLAVNVVTGSPVGGELNVSELAFLKKPERNDTVFKAYRRDLKKVSEKGLLSVIEL